MKKRVTWVGPVNEIPNKIIEKANDYAYIIDGVEFITSKSFRVIPVDENVTYHYIKIHLTNDKKAWLIIPTDITAEEVKLLFHALDGVSLRVSMLNDGQSAQVSDTTNDDSSNTVK